MTSALHGDPDVAHEGEILRTVVGSGVHGIAIDGLDDRDEMGVYIEPARMVVGLEGWSYPHNRVLHTEAGGMPHFVHRTRADGTVQAEGARSGPGDTDLVSYSLRKYLRLAAKGNPTALLPLWAPEDDVLSCTMIGERLRGMRDLFMSQQAVHRFLGYMRGQHERMLGKSKRNVPNRPELIEKYGWDVKYGAHALRLAYQGLQIARSGTLTLPMPDDEREHVLAVKRGEVTREETSAMIGLLTHSVEWSLDHGSLPFEPDWATISVYSEWAHMHAWGLR